MRIRRVKAPSSRLGLRARATVAACIGALVVTSLLSLIAYVLVRNFLLDQRDSVTQRQTFVNARVVRDVLRSPDPEVGDLLASLRAESGSFAFVYWDSQWYGTSVGLSDTSLPSGLREAVVDGETGSARFAVEDVAWSAVVVAIPAVSASYIEVFPLDSLASTLRVLRNSLLAAATITAIGGAALGYWASRRVMAPVADVADAAAAIAQGGFDTRLVPENDRDLRTLALSFNAMADAVQKRIEREARFASDVSHELRTPLTVIAGVTQVLDSRREELPERSRQALDILTAQLNRFNQLVLDLLEISRIDAGVADVHLESIGLADLTAKVAAGAGYGDVEVAVSPGMTETRVMVDKRRFERILTNLLDNALHHGGGPVCIRVEGSLHHVRVAVDDAGPGIANADRDRIFERFARGPSSSSQGHGTGLGLALVSEHARLLGGRVWVTDSRDGGARFILELPRETES